MSSDHDVEPRHGDTLTHNEHGSEPDRPEDWGWHAETGKWARLAGWITAALLLVMNIGNQTRHNENFWLCGIALLIVVILLVDRHHRKNAWRK